jgi:NADH-quinone oxidoreductase subunit M
MQEHILSILIFFPALAAMFGFVVHKDSVRAYGITVAAIEFFLSFCIVFFIFRSNKIKIKTTHPDYFMRIT